MGFNTVAMRGARDEMPGNNVRKSWWRLKMNESMETSWQIMVHYTYIAHTHTYSLLSNRHTRHGAFICIQDIINNTRSLITAMSDTWSYYRAPHMGIYRWVQSLETNTYRICKQHPPTHSPPLVVANPLWIFKLAKVKKF